MNMGKTGGYEIYNVQLIGGAKKFGGLAWVVDGELGRKTYPGTSGENYVRALYRRGWSWDHPYDQTWSLPC